MPHDRVAAAIIDVAKPEFERYLTDQPEEMR